MNEKVWASTQLIFALKVRIFNNSTLSAKISSVAVRLVVRRGVNKTPNISNPPVNYSLATRGTQERGLTRLRDIRQENHRETRDFRNLEESSVPLWGKDYFTGDWNLLAMELSATDWKNDQTSWSYYK